MVRDDVLHAYARLENDPDFAAVMEDLSSRMEAARDSMDTATDLIQVGRHQGCALVLKDILRLAQGGASEALTKRHVAARSIRKA